MFITADLAHRPITDLEFTSRYYDKIFHHILEPPRWLAHNLQKVFEQDETANGTTFL